MTIRFGSIQFQSPRCVWTKFFSISLSGIFNASKFKCPTMQYGPLNVSLQFRSRPHVRNWKLTNVPSLFSSSLRYPISILYPTKKQKKKNHSKKKSFALHHSTAVCGSVHLVRRDNFFNSSWFTRLPIASFLVSECVLTLPASVKNKIKTSSFSISKSIFALTFVCECTCSAIITSASTIRRSPVWFFFFLFSWL